MLDRLNSKKIASLLGLVLLSLGLLSGLMVSMTASVARAQNEESEEARQAAEKAKRRRYPGGKDEQELTVQAVLPVPSRYPQDPKAAAPGTAKEQPVDEGHD